MAYSYYRSVRIDPSLVPSTQFDFPVVLEITLPTGHVFNPSGYDIRPYADILLTIPLIYELASYDSTTGDLELWVKIGNLSSSLFTTFYLAYGDATITTDGSSSSTWSNNFLGVYHFSGPRALNVSSSTGINNGTNNGASFNSAGQIGGAASLFSQYVDCGTGMNPVQITLSAWINATAFLNPYNAVIVRGILPSNYSYMFVKSNGKMATGCFSGAGDVSSDGTGTAVLSTGTWYYLTLAYYQDAGVGGPRMNTYVNANLDAQRVGNGLTQLSTSPAPTNVGLDVGTAGRFWNGLIDEARIASVPRSSDWITTEYNNQSGLFGFISLGPEISLTSTTPKVLSASLSFVGSLTKIPNKVVRGVLSFIGSSLQRLNGVIQIAPFSAALNTSGRVIKQARKLLPPFNPYPPSILTGLGFKADFLANPSTVGTIQVFFSSLLNVSSGSVTKKSIPMTVSSLGLIGDFVTLRRKILVAILSFAGLVRKSTARRITATLPFIGVMTNTFPYFVTLLQGSLSFTGKVTKQCATKLTATSFFSGVRLTRLLPRLLTASVLFSGLLRAVFHLYTQSLTAALSFIGSITRLRGKIFAATLSFAGTVRKSTRRSMSAISSFVGVLNATQFTALIFKSLASTLSFVGVINKQSARSLSGILSFAGNLLSSSVLKKMLTASLSFAGSFIRGWLLQSVLSFVGTLRKFTPVLRLSSAVSFTGVFTKKSSRSFQAALSFIGNFAPSKIRFVVSTAMLSFVGNIKPIQGRVFKAAISFIGDLQRRIGTQVFMVMTSRLSSTGSVIKKIGKNISQSLRLFGGFGTVLTTPLHKSLSSILDFTGSILVDPGYIAVLLESVIRFRGRVSNGFGNLVALFNVLITTIGQTLLGVSREDHDSLTVVNTQQTIGGTPTILDVDGTSPLSPLFIKNLDGVATVEVDSSSDFDLFPQLIVPKSGIYLSPELPFSAIYARSSIPSSDVQIIYSRRKNPNPFTLDFSELQFTGSLGTYFHHPGLQPPVLFESSLSFMGSLILPETAIYIGFRLNIHSPTSSTHPDLFWLSDSSSQYFAVYPFWSGGNFALEWYGWDNWTDSSGGLLRDTYYTVEMKVLWDGSIYTVTPRLDGVELATFTDATIGPITHFRFGAPFAAGSSGDFHHMDDLTIGTTGWGSSNVLSADFASSIVPPFDSISGTGLSIDSGALLVDDSVGATWAEKAVSFP